VLVNLMVNAAQAMSHMPGRRRLTLASRVMPDRTVLLVVSDTGPGIPDKDMDRLFNAFHDQAGRHGDGPVDLPEHRGNPTVAASRRSRRRKAGRR
jgi:K+-sensing histidine kinase KdpD